MELALRRLRSHWRLSLAVLLWLTLASALLASLSGYGAAIAARELTGAVEEASPAERTLLIRGTPYTFGDALYESLKRSLGKALKDRMVICHATLPADAPPPREELGRKQAVASLHVYSLDHLSGDTRVIRGRLPAQVSLIEAAGSWPPPVEAVIGQRAAEQSGYAMGDRVTARGFFYRLDIVGIVEPIDPDDDLWGGDLSAFAVVTGTGAIGADAMALPLIIAPESMQSSTLGGPIFPHDTSWRITLNHRRIGPGTAEALYSGLSNFQAQAAAMGAHTSSAMLRILSDALARLSRLRMALLLLSSQTLVLVLYTLTMFTSFTVDRSRAEVATLGGRGMSAWKITRVFALEILLLAFPAVLFLGPGLALAAVHLWGHTSGTALPSRSFAEIWRLPTIAAGVGWAALVLSIYLAARRALREPQPRRAQPPPQPALHRRYVDLCLLAFGGLLVWQLNRSGTLLARVMARSRLVNTPWADPLLLLGPFVLLLAAAMVFLRVVPSLLRLVARLFQHRRGLVLRLAVLRPARNPLQSSHAVLLVSLTTGLVLFARILGDSLTHGQAGLRSGTLVQGIADALQLNNWMLALFGTTTFFLVQLVGAQGRGRELGILRALGLRARQWPAIAVAEGALVLILGLPAGAVFGLGLSYTLIPYLSPALADPLAGSTIEGIVVAWPATIRLFGILLGLHASALALLWLALRRERGQPTPWREDE
jgi:hypothetical protein